MLQVHPDSTCDVCLDPYTFSNPAKTPHAIACGHVFCLECLAHLNHPTSCPLCRKSFGMDRVKKLHVDRHVPVGREAATSDAWSLVQRLSRCVRSEVDTRTTEQLIGEAQSWLAADNHKELFPEVDTVLSALVKYKSLQERFHDQQATITSLTARLHREEAMKDDNRKDALVEHSLTRKIQELEAQLDFYRHHFPGVRDLAREHHPRVNSPASEDRANGGRNSNNQSNRLPSPPRLIWHPFTARNPNFVPSGNPQEPYSRTSIPPVYPQPYAYQTGAGAVYYEGAKYEDRVVPPLARDRTFPDVPPEGERARSRSTHGDHSPERRSRRRDGESDKHRRRRDRNKRDTLDSFEPVVRPGQPSTIENALGIQTSSHPTQGIYSSMPPPVTSTSDPSTSRAGGASSSHPPTRLGISPPIAIAASVPGYPYSAAPHSNGVNSFYSRAPDPTSRPSSTPIGPVISSWAAPDLANPSLNSLGLSAQALDGGNTAPQTVRAASASIPQTTRDSVSSWGTADSTPAQGDVFATLHPLGSAPADGDLPHSDLYPRSDGQLLGVVRAQQFRPSHYPASLVRQGRTVPIATPQPQLAQASTPQPFGGPSNRDTDSRSYSRHAHHPRSQSQTSLFANHRDTSQLPTPPRFTPDDRGFPYASVPPPPPPPSVSFPTPHPHSAPRSTTPGSRRSSHSIPIPPFPSIPPISAPPPVNTASRPPSNAPQTYNPSASSSHSQNPSHRPYY